MQSIPLLLFSVSHSFLSGHVFDTLHFFFKFTSSFAIENRRFFDRSCHIYIPPIIKNYDSVANVRLKSETAKILNVFLKNNHSNQTE